MEQQPGPPSTDSGREEVKPSPALPEAGANQPEADVSRPREAEPKVEPSPEAGPTEAGPIMSNLPHSRPQQRSQRRRAPAKARSAAGRQTPAATPSRKRAAGRAQAAAKAPSAARGRSRTQGRSNARATTAEVPSGDAPGIPALAVDAAVQIAKAPFKLTVAATRRTAGLIGRGLRL